MKLLIEREADIRATLDSCVYFEFLEALDDEIVQIVEEDIAK